MEQPTVVCHVSDVTVDFEATLKDVKTSLYHVVVFLFFFCLLRVLEVFGLNAT